MLGSGSAAKSNSTLQQRHRIFPTTPLQQNATLLIPQVELEGEALYGKFCVHCHGAAGLGDGKVGAKLPGPPPAYNGALKDLPEGKIFHSITYGKNSMGNHASILNTQERWTLVHYVQKLQGPKTIVADSTAKAVPTATVVEKNTPAVH